MFNVWPKTTLRLPVWPRDAKRLDTPEDEFPLQPVYSIVTISRGLLFYDLARFAFRFCGLEIMKPWF